MWCQSPINNKQCAILCSHLLCTWKFHTPGGVPSERLGVHGYLSFHSRDILTALCHLSPGPGIGSLNPQLLAGSSIQNHRQAVTTELPHQTLNIIRPQKNCPLPAPYPNSPLLKDTAHVPFGNQNASHVSTKPESPAALLEHR